MKLAEEPDIPTVEELSAFADGALDATRSADVLEYLSRNGEIARNVARDMRMRGAIGRAMHSMAPAPTDRLRQNVSEIIEQGVRRLGGMSPWRAGIQTQLRVAAAALFLIAVGIFAGKLIFAVRPIPGVREPTELVWQVTHVHVDCSRAPDAHNLPFPQKLGEMADQLKSYLGRPVPYPDLSSIGYEFIGAGPCSRPLDGMVHLLYRSSRKPLTDTVSLFVVKYANQQPMEDGEVYWGQSKNAYHPVLMWRHGDLLLILVGDDAQPLRNAAELMHENPPAFSS